MIDPAPCARIRGIAKRAAMKWARTIRRQLASIPAGSTASSVPSTWMPAWLSRMSSRP
jgi:hypothetical protein